MIDQEQIINALRSWFSPGDVFEVRVLDASTADYRREHVESGYFDYDHIHVAADAIGQLRSYRGAYVTVNPVNPDLLARAVNRIRATGKAPTTSDTDVLRRNWLLIDCDAQRPSGISSNDEEHEAALAKAREIRDDLSTIGWAEPIMTDSGNGAQLMYRIDLPVDDDGLVQKCIKGMATASDDKVKVDLTVYNPARIWRIPGTMNCKGDSIPARPHRMAKIISKPEKLEVITQEQLESVAQFSEKEIMAGEIAESHSTPDGFNLDSWIQQYCPELDAPRVWKDGRKWIFPTCPFNLEHTDKSAVLIQQPSGAIAFKCHHNGCTGNDWHKLRSLLEPGCYDQLREGLEIDLSGILNQSSANSLIAAASPVELPEPEIIRPWREITSDDIAEQVLEGTLLGELTEIYSSVTRPPLPLEAALIKALVTLGCCTSGQASAEELQRRHGGNLGAFSLTGADRAKLIINTSGGQVCNIYGMIAANSATGKDIGNLIGRFTRMNNPDISCADGDLVMANWDLGTAGSAEGLAQALIYKPNGLVSISELSNWLDEHHWQNKATLFLTEAFGQGYYSQQFSNKGKGGGSRMCDYCAPNIIANIQPKVFERIVNFQEIDNGFLGRFLFARMPNDFYGSPRNFDSIKIMEQIRLIVDVFLRKRGKVELEEGYSDELQKVFLGNVEPKLNASWRRLINQYYPRFMVFLSVTNSIKTQGECIIITEEARQRAKILTLWFFANAEKMLINIVDNVGNSREVEQRMKRIFEIVRDSERGQGVLTSEISRKASGTGTNSKQRQEILQELRERQWIKLDGIHYSVDRPPPGMAEVRKKKR